MLIKELYTNSQKYIPCGISFLTVSRFSALSRPSFVPVCVSVLGLGLTNRTQPIRSSACSADLGLIDQSQPIRSSACSADATDVELVSQHSLTHDSASTRAKCEETLIDMSVSSGISWALSEIRDATFPTTWSFRREYSLLSPVGLFTWLSAESSSIYRDSRRHLIGIKYGERLFF